VSSNYRDVFRFLGIGPLFALELPFAGRKGVVAFFKGLEVPGGHLFLSIMDLGTTCTLHFSMWALMASNKQEDPTLQFVYYLPGPVFELPAKSRQACPQSDV